MCCVVIPLSLDVRFGDIPAGVTQEEGHTGILHLPSAMPVLLFLAIRIQLFLFLVDREVEFCVLKSILNTFYFGQTPENDIPPWFRATKGYT